MRPRTNLLQNKLAKIEYENGNKARPMIHLDKKLLQELYVPWQDALGIKLIGKSINYLVLKDCLKNLWKLQGGFELMNVDNGFYMVKFDTMETEAR